MARTKIICTLGPATIKKETIAALVEKGMNVARINFSHGSYDDKLTMIAHLREVSRETGNPIAILGDLSGPKIRVGDIEGGVLPLEAGDLLTITSANVIGKPGLISTNYTNLVSDVEKDNRILLDDGAIELRVEDIRPEEVRTRVIIGGELKPRKGMNLPGVKVSIPSITAKDFKDIEFAIANQFDLLALSFVRSPDDVIKAKKLISNFGADTPIIAKIEKEEAVQAFDKVLAAADGVMVARGDLGVEMASEQVPLIQKRIIRKSNDVGKPVITATQMLESMITNSRPTRAETSDVANAVIDGSDAVMLSGETAVGDYPVKACETMYRIITGVECEVGKGRSMVDGLPDVENIEDAVTAAACRAAELLKAKCIVAYTQTGSTAMRLSKYRPRTRILAFTPSDAIMRRLAVYWGVRSVLVQEIVNTDSMVSVAEKIAVGSNLAVPGDIIVVVSGTPIGVAGSTNMINVHRI